MEIWTWSLDVDAAEQAALTGLLSDDERSRAARFVKPLDGLRWTVARARMRQILGRELARDPAGLRFDVGEFGRPALEGGPSFNLSHSGAAGLLALSHQVDVGADIEAVRPMAVNEMEAGLSNAERRGLGALSEDARLGAFFRLWTSKEAFVKALGRGVSTPLESFDISLADPARPIVSRWADRPEGCDEWRLVSAEPMAGYVASVAARACGRAVRFDWREGLE